MNTVYQPPPLVESRCEKVSRWACYAFVCMASVLTIVGCMLVAIAIHEVGLN